jgi:DNA-binding Xre family transcriptional regulator
LAPQIALAAQKLRKEHGVKALAEAMGVTTNTVRSCMSGVGMKLSTFETLCRVAGWTLEVRDADGEVIARLR